MKIILKWVSIFVIPSILLFLYIYNDFLNTTDQERAIFFTLHFLFAGAAIYFTLTEIKKTSTENVSALRYIITGIMVSVSHAILFGLFSGLYFNYVRPEAKQEFVDKVLVKGIVQSRDSSSSSLDEYYNSLMQGKDTGFLTPEVYKKFQLAAQDSVNLAKQEIATATEQSFGIYYVILRWVGIAPLIGILFSVVITVFIVKR